MRMVAVVAAIIFETEIATKIANRIEIERSAIVDVLGLELRHCNLAETMTEIGIEGKLNF